MLACTLVLLAVVRPRAALPAVLAALVVNLVAGAMHVASEPLLVAIMFVGSIGGGLAIARLCRADTALLAAIVAVLGVYFALLVLHPDWVPSRRSDRRRIRASGASAIRWKRCCLRPWCGARSRRGARRRPVSRPSLSSRSCWSPTTGSGQMEAAQSCSPLRWRSSAPERSDSAGVASSRSSRWIGAFVTTIIEKTQLARSGSRSLAQRVLARAARTALGCSEPRSARLSPRASAVAVTPSARPSAGGRTRCRSSRVRERRSRDLVLAAVLALIASLLVNDSGTYELAGGISVVARSPFTLPATTGAQHAHPSLG